MFNPTSPEFVFRRSRPASPELVSQQAAQQIDSPYEPLYGLGSALRQANPAYATPFPSVICDRQASDRIEHLLGMRSMRGLPQFRVNGLSARHWIYTWMFKLIEGKASVCRLALTGGGASFAIGQGLLRWGLNALQLPPQLAERLKTEINRDKALPSDLDFELVLDCPDLNWLQEAIDAKPCEQVKLHKKEAGKVLIIRIGDCMDIFVHTKSHLERADDHVFALDNMRIDLLGSNLEHGQLRLLSSNPWDWWRSHTLGRLIRQRPGDGNVISRLVGKTLRGHLAEQDIAGLCAEGWLDKLGFNADALGYESEKFATEHGRSPLSRPLWALRVQQLLLCHGDQLQQLPLLLRGAINFRVQQEHSRFTNMLFAIMQKDNTEDCSLIRTAHALVESLATLALCQAWQEPFSVQLVEHGGKLCQRLRFKNADQNLTLIVDFKPEQSLATLSQADPEQWRQLRMLLHCLWSDGIKARQSSAAYHETLSKHVAPRWPKQFESLLLSALKSNKAARADAWSEIPSFLELLQFQQLPLTTLPKLARELVEASSLEASAQSKLLWSLIDCCLSRNADKQALDILDVQTKKQLALSPKARPRFFELLSAKRDPQILKRLSPWPAPDDWSPLESCRTCEQRKEALLHIFDTDLVDDETYLTLFEELAVTPEQLSPRRLTKLLTQLERPRAYALLQSMHKASLREPAYRSVVNRLIADADETELPAAWVEAYLCEKAAFVGSPEQLEGCLTQCVQGPSSVLAKAEILQAHHCKTQSLWSTVGDEFLMQDQPWPERFAAELGSDAETLRHWKEFLDLLTQLPQNTEAAMQKLKAVRGKELPVKRGDVVMRLLAQWNKCPVDAAILQELLPFPAESKYSWAKVTEDVQSIGDLHARMAKYAPLPHTVAFLRASPPKAPGYHKRLANRLIKAGQQKPQKLKTALKDPRYCEVLAQQPAEVLPVLELIELDTEGIEICLRVLGREGKCGQQFASKLLCASVQGLEQGDEQQLNLALRCYQTVHQKKFAKACHTAYRDSLVQLASAVLENAPKQLKIAVEIWDCLGSEQIKAAIPSTKTAKALLRCGGEAWLVDMLHAASAEQRQQVDSEVFDAVARKLLSHSEPDIDLTARLVLSCDSSSNTIRSCWERCLANKHLRWAELCTLSERAVSLNLSEPRIESAIQAVMQRQGRTPDEFLRSLVHLLPHMSFSVSAALWSLIERRGCVQREALWSAALALLGRQAQDPIPAPLAKWIFSKQHGTQRRELLPLLPTLLARLPQHVRAGGLRSYLECEADSNISDVHKLNACLAYWELLEDYLPDVLPDLKSSIRRLPSSMSEERRIDILYRLVERGLAQDIPEQLDTLSCLLRSVDLPLSQSPRHLALVPHLRAAICRHTANMDAYHAANWLQEAWLLFDEEQAHCPEPYSAERKHAFTQIVERLNPHAATVASSMLDLLQAEACPWTIPGKVLAALALSPFQVDNARVIQALAQTKDLSWLTLSTCWHLTAAPGAEKALRAVVTHLPHEHRNVYDLVVSVGLLQAHPCKETATRAVARFINFGTMQKINHNELGELSQHLPKDTEIEPRDRVIIEREPHRYAAVQLLVVGLQELLQLNDKGKLLQTCLQPLSQACTGYHDAAQRILANWCYQALLDARQPASKQAILELLMALMPSISPSRLGTTLAVAARELCLHGQDMDPAFRGRWNTCFDRHYARLVPKDFLAELWRGRLSTIKWPQGTEQLRRRQLAIFLTDICSANSPLAAKQAVLMLKEPMVFTRVLDDPQLIKHAVRGLSQILLPEDAASFEELMQCVRSPNGYTEDPFVQQPCLQQLRCEMIDALLGSVPDAYFPRLIELFVQSLRSVYVGLPLTQLDGTLEKCFACCNTYLKGASSQPEKQRLATALMRFLLAQPHPHFAQGQTLLDQHGFHEEAEAVGSVSDYIQGSRSLHDWKVEVLTAEDEACEGLEAEVASWKLIWWIRTARSALEEQQVDQAWNLLRCTALYLVMAQRMTAKIPAENPLVDEVRYELSCIVNYVIGRRETEPKEAAQWLLNINDFVAGQNWQHAPERTAGLLHVLTQLIHDPSRKLVLRLQKSADALREHVGADAADSVSASALLQLIREGSIGNEELIELCQRLPAFMRYYYPSSSRVQASQERILGYTDVCCLTLAGINASVSSMPLEQLKFCLKTLSELTQNLGWLGCSADEMLISMMDLLRESLASHADEDKVSAVMELIYALTERLPLGSTGKPYLVFRYLAELELLTGRPVKLLKRRETYLKMGRHSNKNPEHYHYLYACFLSDCLSITDISSDAHASSLSLILNDIDERLNALVVNDPQRSQHFRNWRKKLGMLRKELRSQFNK